VNTPVRITYMSKLTSAVSLSVAVVAVVALAVAPVAVSGQVVVGHTPESSPFHDIDANQRITLFGGYMQAQGDGLSTTPQSGPSFGLRYDLPVAGPADFYVRFQRVNSNRDAFNPALIGNARALGQQSLAMYSGDLGFALNLTGRRTWHGFIPNLNFGLGIVSAAGTTKDDPYDFGTQFAFNTGIGLRYNPANSYEIRLDAGPTFYQNHFPPAYYTGTAPLLANTVSRSGYQHSMNFTAGLSIPIFR